MRVRDSGGARAARGRSRTTRAAHGAGVLRAVLARVITLVIAIACGSDRKGPAPSGTSAAIDAPTRDSSAFVPVALAPSRVAVPIRYDLAPAIAVLEQAVPRTFGDLADRKPVTGHKSMSYAFDATRTGFDVRVRGTTVTISSVVAYRARGWVKPVGIGPSLSGSCGMDDEPPRLRITLVSALRLAPDWTLRANTAVPTVAPMSDSTRDKCRVTIVNLDVTDRAVAAVRAALEGKATLLDERIRRVDVRSKVGTWWAILGRPIRMGNDAWLEIRPESVSVGTLRASGRTMVAPVTLVARPRIATGSRPDSSTIALPDITPRAKGEGATDSAETGLHLLLEAVLGYDVATRMLTRQLVGRHFERGGQSVTVRAASVFPAAGGRVALALALVGDVDARVVFAGRPAYDRATGMLAVPDLDYSVADASLLVRGADGVAHDALRDALRDRARFPITALIDSARLRAERAMNRELTRGVVLGATVTHARALGVRAAPDGFRVQAEALGTLSLDVDRAPSVRRRRAASAASPAKPEVKKSVPDTRKPSSR